MIKPSSRDHAFSLRQRTSRVMNAAISGVINGSRSFQRDRSKAVQAAATTSTAGIRRNFALLPSRDAMD